MMKIAVFPGSFDPITIGHEAIVLRSLKLFDKIILAIGENSSKKNMFSLEDRKESLKNCFQGIDKIEVDSYSGLTIKYCEKIGAQYLLRGLRISSDFEYERNIASLNLEMNNNIESIFLISEPRYSAISSSIVREIYKNGGDISSFVPTGYKL